MKENIDAPWMDHYGEVQATLDYPTGTMADAVFSTAGKYPGLTALSFMGKNISYKKLTEKVNETAQAFLQAGISEGDMVTVCMPNVPQAIYCLYALNRIGAVAAMIHPLSAIGEIVFYIKETNSRCVVTLDQFYSKFTEVMPQVDLDMIIYASVKDELSVLKAIGYSLTSGKDIPKIREDSKIRIWNRFISDGKKHELTNSAKKANDPAVVLFSGGTTGVTKGILLSNLNFNALAYQTGEMNHNELVGKSMLAAMPIFHGFGLGVCIHTALATGARAILIPRFNPKQYAMLLKKEQPNYIAGVPTLYEAITRNEYLDNVDLSCLMGVFSGGDSLSIELKKKFDKFLADHGAKVRVREGYGTTECVTASCLTPYNEEKEGSIGIPYPDTFYKICAVGTTDEVPYGTEGEICIHGPSVMLGYLNRPEETEATLRKHEDGYIWLHTGDLGNIDSDGFIYFRQRIKRMIISSGYNVYPSQIENILDSHPAVKMSCVIGVKDDYKMQKVKAFVTLNAGYSESEELKQEILEFAKKHIAKYAMPYDIEFRKEFPKTLVGKVAFRILEEEEEQKTKNTAAIV